MLRQDLLVQLSANRPQTASLTRGVIATNLKSNHYTAATANVRIMVARLAWLAPWLAAHRNQTSQDVLLAEWTSTRFVTRAGVCAKLPTADVSPKPGRRPLRRPTE